jgi:iron(II)-dependent oxidoreductase
MMGTSMAGIVKWTWALAGLATLAAGYLLRQPVLVGAGLATLIYGVIERCAKVPQSRGIQHIALEAASPPPEPVVQEVVEGPITTESLVQQMLAQQRYALLLRPEIVASLTAGQAAAARRELEAQMCLVPAGEVRMGTRDFEVTGQGDFRSRPEGLVVRVEAYLIDRYCVSNKQYQLFVDAGGYSEMALWDQEIWPGVLQFVDQTGFPGPRFWRNGKHPRGLENHPVVGVSWYEAAAYARWCGKRLLTDPEWQKAACWPAQLLAGGASQRRFPWGDTLDRGKANLWITGIGGTVPVDEFGEGASIGGAYQMVGNVWEWTASSFGAFTFLEDELVLPTALRSLRGGAFDTYFEHQATCQFESGEDPTARLHNVGFRCAVSLCDLKLDASDGDPERAGSESDDQASEVAV